MKLNILIGLIIVLLIVVLLLIFIKSSKSKNENFKETPFQIQQLPIIDTIEIRNKKNSVQLLEVEVLNKEGNNIASLGIPTQSSTMEGGIDLYKPEFAIDKLFNVERTKNGHLVGVSSTAEKDVNIWSLNFQEPIEIKQIKISYFNNPDNMDVIKKMNDVRLALYKDNILIDERKLITDYKVFRNKKEGYWMVDYSIPEKEKKVVSNIIPIVSSYELEKQFKSDIYLPKLVEANVGAATRGGYYTSPSPETGSFSTLPIPENIIYIQYVRIERLNLDPNNENSIIHLGEVQVFDNSDPPKIISNGKNATQSSNLNADTPADLAVNGITYSTLIARDLAHTNKEANPWWEVDLGQHYQVTKIIVWNRQDCCPERMIGAYIKLLDRNRVLKRTIGPIQNASSKYEFIV